MKEYIKGFIDKIKDDDTIDIKTLAIAINGEKILTYEKEPYSIEDLQLMFSMTKSITSLAIGIAQDRGLLKIDELLVDIFKENPLNKKDKNLNKIRIRDLLIMACGIHDDSYTEIFKEKNWIKAFLNQKFIHEPGTYYRYSTHGTHMLSAIIEKKAKLNLKGFLTRYLFEPLNIKNVSWESAPDGVIAGGMGLSLRTCDILKIGQLLIDKGMYKGNKIISKEYIEEATRGHIVKKNERGIEEKIFSGNEYGFQVHIDGNGNYRFDGAFGQLCFMSPANDIVIVVTSAGGQIENILKHIYKEIIYEKPHANIAGKCSGIDRKLIRIVDKSNRCNSTVKLVETINCKREFILEKNSIGTRKISITLGDSSEKDGTLSIDLENGLNYVVNFRPGFEVEGKGIFIKDLQNHCQKYVTYSIWEGNNKIKIIVFYTETPYVVEYNIVYFEKSIELSFNINCSFTLKNFKVMGHEI